MMMAGSFAESAVACQTCPLGSISLDGGACRVCIECGVTSAACF